MKPARRYWAFALVVALSAHAFLLTGFYTEQSGAVALGEGGVDIALAMGAPVSNAPETETTEAPAEEVVEPETEEAPPEREALPPEPASEVTPSPSMPQPTISPKSSRKTAKSKPVGAVNATPGATPSMQTFGGGRQGQADYHALLQAWLQRHKQYPFRARSRRQQGTVMLFFVIDRQGRVLERRIEKSSGYKQLDEATLELIERASPMPPPPPEIKGARLTFLVPIDYWLR